MIQAAGCSRGQAQDHEHAAPGGGPPLHCDHDEIDYWHFFRLQCNLIEYRNSGANKDGESQLIIINVNIILYFKHNGHTLPYLKLKPLLEKFISLEANVSKHAGLCLDENASVEQLKASRETRYYNLINFITFFR